jgi:trimeric autotransporter adhesin
MVVATNAAFTTGVETVFLSTLSGNQTCLFDFDGTKFITFGVAHRAVNPLHITLDGIDDFVRIGDANELGAIFTVMTWVRPNGSNTLGTERTILSKKPNATSGYQIVLQNDNKIRVEWYASSGGVKSLISNTAIPNGVWHNIAVTYSNSSKDLIIYIDGVFDKSKNIPQAPAATTSMFSIGAQYIDKLNINNLWKGDIDELRMWSRVLSPTEIRFIMNQEILQNGTGTRGTIIPNTITKNDIPSLLWSDLFAYYSMNSYIGTHLDDDSVNINRGSLVIPDKVSINVQTAPMPYESNSNGLWSDTSSWKNGAIQDLAYSLSIVDGVTPIEWNIVKTNHNVESTGNKVLLGLFVDSNTLSASNDTKVEVSHYLKLNGKIDLVGKSQLVQTLNSDFDPTSSGSLERDQQGQKNKFNYNYWSSPVSSINNTTINHGYTVAGVMKDGTSESPANINWTTGLNGSATSPITLSRYWIFKFQNLAGNYANWQSVGENGALQAGQGYTLKGSNAATLNQNYTFVGKPNNGLITSVVAANNLNLSGNPYTSALDANVFITANSSTTTGTLYFWEHFSTNNTHVLANYQGGYAARTLVGGTPPIAPAGISGLGSSTKIPNRYIPVGQGFFLMGSATGGAITYNNNQRAFVKENNVSSNTLFRAANSTVSSSEDHFTNNDDDSYATDSFKRIRLGFVDRNNYHRQILIGFMDEYATSNIDPGYDAIHIDSQPNDMYFVKGSNLLNIAGESYFNTNDVFPIGVKTDGIGNVTFGIDGIENFDSSITPYIYDNVTNIYHNIQDEHFQIELPLGTINNRFSLRFTNGTTLSTNSFNLNDSINVAYNSNESMLNIKNNSVNITIQNATLYNLLGQLITTWNVEESNQQNIQLKVNNYSTGTYIVKIKTDQGDISKKIIIK